MATSSNANPVITASVVDTNATTIALTGNSSKLIKYYSNAKATMTVVAQNGAAIDQDMLIIRNGNETIYGYGGTFYNVTSNGFFFSAEDSRGNIGIASVSPTMVNYVKLTCYLRNNRPDANGNMTVECEGDYFNGSFGAVSNTLTVQYRYKIQGGSYGQWQNMSITKNGNYYIATASLEDPYFNYENTYVFECRASDRLETSTSAEISVKSRPVFHWGEKDFAFEVPVSVNDDCDIAGNLSLYGALLFEDEFGSDASIRSDDGQTIHLSAPTVKISASNLYVNNSTLADLFFPVNSIVIRYDHLSPASIFGGTWTRVTHSGGGATFLYGCTASGVIGECGGESTHTLTVNEIPSHTHSLNVTSNGSLESTSYFSAPQLQGGNYYMPNTRPTGGGAAHNNMPPYIKVSIWRRTA